MTLRLAHLFLAGLLLTNSLGVSAQIYSRADAREGAFARTKIAAAYMVVVNACVTHVPEETDLSEYNALVARYEALRKQHRRTPRRVDFEIIESEYELQRIPEDLLELECGPRSDPEALVFLKEQTKVLSEALGPLEDALKPAMAEGDPDEAFEDADAMGADDMTTDTVDAGDLEPLDAENVALIQDDLPDNELIGLDEYPHPFDGEWTVDLRLDLFAEPYSQPMKILVSDADVVTGTFYGSTIESGRVGTAQNRTCMAFRTSDNSGPYQHAACLIDDLIVGQSWSEGRDFVNPWTAERKK
ncbi:MAG: hypothetical protein AAFR88_12775 [Pseudomonadota bacterium]